MKRQFKISPAIAVFSAFAAVTVAGTFGFSQMRNHPSIVTMPIAVAPPVTVSPPVSIATPGQVTVNGILSQTKVLQGSLGEVFMDVMIETPEDKEAARGIRRATDMIVVLDRSGSMTEANKLSFAKVAIRDLAERMQPQDRLAIVSFDDTARLDLPLSPVNASTRQTVNGIIDRIQPGGSTNIGEGFENARGLIQTSSERITRVLLLSDGDATAGITDPDGLSQIVKGLVRKGSVVSTIGMGLGFNQSLLSRLADHGMGNYAYLESLGSLGQILNKDLQESRGLYASTSELTINVPDGVSITDAGGYPVEAVPGQSGRFRIATGQLLAGARKSFMITFRVPTDQRREMEVARLGFEYNRQNRALAGKFVNAVAQISIVENQAVAAASIHKDVYRKGWVANNLGKLKASFGTSLSRSDAEGARAAIAKYKGELKEAEKTSGIPLAATAEVAEETQALEADLSSSFTGNTAADMANQNRLAKKQHAESRAKQRSN